MNEKKREQLRAKLLAFKQQYQRKRRKGYDPNDRDYSHKLEEEIKRLPPEELDELIND